MWYLIVDKNSKRYFIKNKSDNLVYFVKENSNIVEEKSIQELKDNSFRVVGEAFDDEIKRLESLITA